MTDRPMPFSAPMVAALLAGSKTQTRRIAKFVDADGAGWHIHNAHGGLVGADDDAVRRHAAHYAPYAIGDRLYVRESYYQRGYWAVTPRPRGTTDKEKWRFVAEGDPTFDAPAEFRLARHRKDPWTVAWHKRLGRFMPRAYSRLTLIVTEIRVERLQDISEADAIAEGLEPQDGGWRSYEMIHIGRHKGKPHPHAVVPNRSPITSYRELWDSINGDGAWDANPWIVALSFTVGRHNIDQVPA